MNRYPNNLQEYSFIGMIEEIKRNTPSLQLSKNNLLEASRLVIFSIFLQSLWYLNSVSKIQVVNRNNYIPSERINKDQLNWVYQFIACFHIFFIVIDKLRTRCKCQEVEANQYYDNVYRPTQQQFNGQIP